jgi:hypothetical protein
MRFRLATSLTFSGKLILYLCVWKVGRALSREEG